MEAPGDSLADLAPPPSRAKLITQQIAAVGNDRRKFIKTSIRELLVHSFFYTFLCVVAFGTVNPPMFYYTEVMSNLFSERKFLTHENRTITMKDVNTVLQFWDFLTEVIAKGLDWNHWYDTHDQIADTQDDDKNILFENKVIGKPYMRQVRVSNSSCVVPDEFKPVFKHCFGYYSMSNEETKSLHGLHRGHNAWKYHSAQELGLHAFTGIVATYSGGGYYHEFVRKLKTDIAQINVLKQKLWIDRSTRAIFIDFVTYNGNINLFCFVKLLFEFPPTGGVFPSPHYRTMKLNRYHGTVGLIVFVCEILIGVLTLYFILEEVDELFALRGDYFASWWTALDLTILGFLIAFIVCAIVRAYLVNHNLEELMNKKDFVSFDSLIMTQNLFLYVVAFLVFFSTLKFLRYLKVNIIMNRLLNIIHESSPALFGFALIFFIILFAFALLGHLLFGTEVNWFSSVFYSLFSLHLMLLGDVDYQDLVDSNRVIGPLFFCTYIFFIFFILLNMFLAILNERFWAKNKQIDLETEDGLCAVLKQSLQYFLSRVGCSGMVDKWQQSEEDRMGLTRLKRLRDSLGRSGFTQAEISAFLNKYKIDENSLGSENALELISKLKSDLQGVGSFDTSVQERIMRRVEIMEETANDLQKKLEIISVKLNL